MLCKSDVSELLIYIEGLMHSQSKEEQDDVCLKDIKGIRSKHHQIEEIEKIKDILLQMVELKNGICENECDALAMGICAEAEGCSTRAVGDCSHAEGCLTIANADCSHAEGIGTDANGTLASHGEGILTIANEIASHTEGILTTASGTASHAEGILATASGGIGSHAEGRSTIASGIASHAEGTETESSGNSSHTEGTGTIASGVASHAEGYNTRAIQDTAHAEGDSTKATALAAHAEGLVTEANQTATHAEGANTTANVFASHSEGFYTNANTEGAHIMGRYGNTCEAYGWHMAGGTENDPLVTAVIRNNGSACFQSVSTCPPCPDFAEMFETIDGKPIDVGYFVTLEGDKIKKANSHDDYILGVTSSTPGFLGGTAELSWKDKYLKDEWGRILYREVIIPEIKDKKGNIIRPEGKKMQKILNPDYNKNLEYISRTERPEWIPVGMLGQILVRDDGKCKVNEYCSSNDDGIATPSESGYRIMKRTGKNQILILFK